ncbi:MAG: enoyl-CoA hydratase, partial [Solirubrobacteraceae bacterium]
EEAHRLGLVTHVADDPLAVALELAREISERSPDAVRGAKRLFNEGWNGPADRTLALEAELQAELIGTANQLAAMTAAMTNQAPRFTDP